jgi:hypothetical protein
VSPNQAGLLIFGLILAGCIVAIVMDRPKKNRRVHRLPKPVPDSRDWQHVLDRWTRS